MLHVSGCTRAEVLYYDLLTNPTENKLFSYFIPNIFPDGIFLRDCRKPLNYVTSS